MLAEVAGQIPDSPQESGDKPRKLAKLHPNIDPTPQVRAGSVDVAEIDDDKHQRLQHMECLDRFSLLDPQGAAPFEQVARPVQVAAVEAHCTEDAQRACRLAGRASFGRKRHGRLRAAFSRASVTRTSACTDISIASRTRSPASRLA